MSEYGSLNWIETTIEVHYKDGSTRLIELKPGDNLADAAGEGWISLSIVESPYGAYSHSNKLKPKISPKGEETIAAGSREGAFDPG
jgi:hypothetical protein